ELYKRGIEHTVLAQHLLACLEHTDDAALQTTLAGLDDAARKTLTTTLAAQLHATAQFETTEDNNLRVVLDPGIIREAVLALLEEGRRVSGGQGGGHPKPSADAVAEEDRHA